MNRNNKRTCIAVVCIVVVCVLLKSGTVLCVCVCMYGGCETNLGLVGRLVCEYLTVMLYKAT